ncbi:helix-turn-helix domain-containing protein [Mycobacterium palustre]|uniref:helix-turn-helix domain-containing protein n=1 Tax=Mycobacterium palustre TaxID=153971 RepID=UPI0013029FD1|nr:helix-turn-helix transcriptional regulator [Mycobacterium palustre]MCV7099460.1 helix-turn-helix transcriptional regulator [Mycobacterium palustre]
MTTLIMIDGAADEPAAAAINRRLRQEFAGRGLSETAAAELGGRKQQWLSRRLTGVTDWAVGELVHFCNALGLSFTYITTGIREVPPMPPNPPAPAINPSRTQRRGGQLLRLPTQAEVSDAVDDNALAYLRLADEAPVEELVDPHRRSTGSGGPAGEPTSKPDRSPTTPGGPWAAGRGSRSPGCIGTSG